MNKIKITQDTSSANVITHGGRFHADECMAIAIYSFLYPTTVFRALDNETKIPDNAIGIDYGMGEFDHHQKGGNGNREDGTPFSSAGLVWKTFGKKLCHSHRQWDDIDRILIEPIDKGDNGIFCKVPASLGASLSLMNPCLDEEDMDGFLPAANMCQNILYHMLNDTPDLNRMYSALKTIRFDTKKDIEKLSTKQRINMEVFLSNLFLDYDYACDKKENGLADILSYLPEHLITFYLGQFVCRKMKKEVEKCSDDTISVVKEGLNNAKNGIVELSKAVPWQETLFLMDVSKKALYVIFPGDRGDYAIRAVPDEAGSFNLRKPLPQKWRGLRSEELAAICGIPDTIFCHNNGFLAVAKTLEGARQMALAAVVS